MIDTIRWKTWFMMQSVERWLVDVWKTEKNEVDESQMQNRTYIKKLRSFLCFKHTRPPTYVVSQTQYVTTRARICAYDKLNLSSRCWNPMTCSPRSTIPLKLKNKAPFKRLRNLILSLKSEQWRLCSWLRGLDWLKVASRCLRTDSKQRRETTSRAILRLSR